MKNFPTFAACVSIAALLHCLPCPGQSIESILAVTGASSLEELDESEYEMLDALTRHPICINTASAGRLRSCGLFNPFQVASIDEWRRSSGDILSIMELGSIEGFTPESAGRLAPFISFASRADIGRSSTESRNIHEMQAKAAMRLDEGSDAAHSWGLKYRYTREDRFSLALATRQELSREGLRPDTWSGNACLFGRRRLGKLILGDYNARFGQGLTMWSGFSMSGVSTVAAFMKKPSGISPAWTYGSACHRGVAADLIAGNITVSGMLSMPGLREMMDRNIGGREHKETQPDVMPAMNISWLGKRATASATAWWNSSGSAMAGADARLNLGAVDIYGESALDLKTGALGATGGWLWTPAWQRKVTMAARYYPMAYRGDWSGAVRSGTKARDEYGLSMGAALGRFEITADAARFPSRDCGQFKTVMSWTYPVNEHLTLMPHSSLRWKEGELRADTRTDCRWAAGRWSANGRLNWLHCKGNAWLAYLEGGFREETFTAWVRLTSFAVGSWDDRIYVYERDAPGNFTVPAYYGKGFSLNAVCGWKRGKSRLHLRAAATRYLSDKPSKVELKLQYSLMLQ